MAIRTARLRVFVVGLATLGSGLFANTNIQAAGDIVWVSAGNSIAAYYANGAVLPSFNSITEQSWPSPGGILVSGNSLYVPTAWWACCPNKAFVYALLKGEAYYLLSTYNAGTGSVTGSSWYKVSAPFVPTGIAQSGANLYVANSEGSIAKGGNLYFIKSAVTNAPYALAVGGPNGNVLYVANNSQNSNGDFYISTYTADNGALINANFIQIPTSGLYGLALSKDDTTLYVSVFSGSAPGVYTYKADTGQLIKGPFVAVNEPWGIAIGGNKLNKLYVASYQDSAIYEFDATTGAQLSDSITLSFAPTNITVEPVGKQ